MRHLRRHTLVASLLVVCCAALAGCGDVAPDVPAPDAAPDVSPDVSPDAAPRDVATQDTAAPDAGTDAGADARTDAPPAPCERPCPAGTQCFVGGCLPVVARGERCELRAPPGAMYPVPCEGGSACIEMSGGARCVALGAPGSQCRYQRPHCDPGYGCDSPTSSWNRCVAALPPGALCAATTQPCESGSSCQDVEGTSRCVRDGAAGGQCREWEYTPMGLDGSRRCDSGLSCGWSGLCQRVLPDGADCQGNAVRCADASTCAPTDRAFRVPRCVARGALGAACRDGGTLCDRGLACVHPFGRGICARRVPRGGACDPTGRTMTCEEGDGCTADDVAETGQCVAPGTAAGADCRGTGTPCDGGLRCSVFSRYRSTCRVVARVGDACDLGAIRTLCPEGTRCVAAASAPGAAPSSRCVAPVAEAEPNDAPATSGAAPQTSSLYRGALSATDRRDCFPVNVPDGASLRLEADGAVVLSVHDATGVEVARWWASTSSHGPTANLSRVTPEAHPLLRRMVRGPRSVCVSTLPPGGAAPYTLTVAVLPPDEGARSAP